MRINPFLYGNPVPPAHFIDRRRELRRIVGRIVNQGQSTAVVGEPRSGKTSLLLHLAAPENRTALYGANEASLVFSYLDAQTLGTAFSQAQFWEHALRPLQESLVTADPDSALAQAFQTCQQNDFGTFVLERLLAQMKETGRLLVLMLDEFDALLYHPVLNSAEFFGGLRGLASRSQGALAVVIGSRQSLSHLNDATQRFSRTGSPYFNFLDEITLGPWPQKAIDELLDRAEDCFSAEDRDFVTGIAGGHPFLLQVAASELWEACQEDEDDMGRRHLETGERLFDKASQILQNTWQLWSPVTCQAFATIAAAQLATLTQRASDGTATGTQGDAKRDEKTRLRNLLTKHFDVEELRTLCYDLDVDYDSLRGEGKAAKARELVEYLERRGRIPELIARGAQERPNAHWGFAPPATQESRFETVAPERLARDFGPELRVLAKQGFIKGDAAVEGGWMVRPAAFLWWLVDEAGWLAAGASALIQAAARIVDGEPNHAL